MHKILFNTHKPCNIDLLKARDYYFDKARNANRYFRNLCLLFPIFLTVVFMIIGTIVNISENDEWLDMIVGFAAIGAFIANIFVRNYINENLSKSNILREEYDCKVLGIVPNQFYGNNTPEKIDELKKVSAFMPDIDKYEVWYREIFSNDDMLNAICLSMDNTIYTKHVYGAYKKRQLVLMIVIAAVFILYSLWFFLTPDDYFVAMVNPFVLFIAIFDWVKDLVESYITSKEQKESAEDVIQYVKNNKDIILNSTSSHTTILRSIEDIVYSNRQQSLFIPKSIRNRFLDNKSPFYVELDTIKSIYWGTDVKKPQFPEDYELPSEVTLSDEMRSRLDIIHEKEMGSVNLKQVHEELLKMLHDVKEALDRHHIIFMLDGGTLIGAMRTTNNHSFLAWDDDIDISIRSDYVKQAIDIIKEELGTEYYIQDCESEPYYSPRLSRFRVRQKNSRSVIDEKDSVLYELYQNRGIFLDVYSYAPIFINPFFDNVYRRLFFYTIHRKIEKVEVKWRKKGKQDKTLKKFLKIKEKYLKRITKYQKKAKRDDYYAYEPYYIEDLRSPGPYIKKEYIYGEDNWEKFEGEEYRVPSRPDIVLSAFYGKKWEVSPYKTIDELKMTKKDDYSPTLFNRLLDCLFRTFMIAPLFDKKEKTDKKWGVNGQQERYIKRGKRYEDLYQKRRNFYYIKASNDKYSVDLLPESLDGKYKKSRYKLTRIGNECENESEKDFDKHMYSKDSFDSSKYKHIKSVYINDQNT